MRFTTQSSFKYGLGVTHIEKVKGVSKTVQGESYTITDLMRKHLSGQMPGIEREPVYNDQDIDNFDLEKVRDMDLAEIDEVKFINTQRISELRHKITKKDQEPKPDPQNVQTPPE